MELKFRKDKETKGAVRYEEIRESPDKYSIGTLYIRKSALEIPYPERINVVITIEV